MEKEHHMTASKEESSLKLSTFFPYLVRLFYRDVSQSITDVYATAYDLAVTEWRTMVVLNDFQPLSAKDIVSRSSMDKVNVSRAVTSLQKKKLLERHIDPTDRRRSLLRLTKKGRLVFVKLVPHVRRVEEQLLNGLTPEERQILFNLMQRVRSNAATIPPFARILDEKAEQ